MSALTERIRSVPLATRMIAASVVLALLVAGAFAVLIQAVSALNNATQREVRANEVRAATFQLEKLVLELESGLRGFAITGEKPFLRPWEAARRSVPGTLAEFERIAGDTPAQKSRADGIVAEIEEYVYEWSDSLLALAREQPEVARTSLATQEGTDLTTEIRRRIDGFLAAENALADASARSANRQYDRAITLAIAGLVASALLILLFGLYLARWMARPVRDVAVAAGQVAEGDLSVRLEEDGPGEIGMLETSFNRMAGQLERGRDELQEQNTKLRESEQLKSELVRIVSHELRTPLASVLGFTSLLLTRDIEPEDQRRYLEIIDSQGRRLSSLLNDFLDVERLEEGQLEMARELVDMRTVVGEQARLFAGQSAKHKLDVVLPPKPLPVRGDANRLAQVVANLLSNAIKYSPDGGTVEVVGERYDNVARVSVHDEGLGIPDELHERIFAKFFRGNAGSSGITGSGLGLTIARSVVEAHGGQMDFESASGKGSTFWLELPIAAGAE